MIIYFVEGTGKGETMQLSRLGTKNNEFLLPGNAVA